jgi:hypothetical protein
MIHLSKQQVLLLLNPPAVAYVASDLGRANRA